MSRLLSAAILFLLLSAAASAQSEKQMYHYFGSANDAGREWWNVMVVSEIGRPVYYFGMDPAGNRRLTFMEGDTNCGKLILDSTVASIARSTNGSYTIFAGRDITFSIMDTASNSRPIRQSLAAGSRLTVETAQYPAGCYIIMAERGGHVVDFVRFKRDDADAPVRTIRTR